MQHDLANQTAIAGPDEEEPGVEGCEVIGLDAAAAGQEAEALSRVATPGALEDDGGGEEGGRLRRRFDDWWRG